MAKLAMWAAGIALSFAAAGACARMHQICYEGEPQNGVSTGIFGCTIDGGGSCTITPGSGMTARGSWPLSGGVQAPGNFAYFNLQGNGPFTAQIDFFDSNNVRLAGRSCSVSPRGATYFANTGYASPGAVLTGFTTDASGLATTGVWRYQAATDSAFRTVSVRAPADFVAVGGGAIGTNAPMGALIVQSARDWNVAPGDVRSWRARTSEAGGAAQPHRTTGFVIGLRIEGMTPETLYQLLVPSPPKITTDSASTYWAGYVAHPALQLPAPAGTVTIGGGFSAFAYGGIPIGTQLGQWGTVNAPITLSSRQCGFINGQLRCYLVQTATGWRAESKDHVIPAPGWIEVQVMALPATLTVNGQTFTVVQGLAWATSAEAAHPAADATGLRGEYALTGIGAAVNWRRYDVYGNQIAAGNLLWKLEPRPDLGGASVASKDHLISSPATITAYGIGFKLVPN